MDNNALELPSLSPNTSEPDRSADTLVNNLEVSKAWLEKRTLELVTGETLEIVLRPKLSGKHFFIYQTKNRQFGQTTADNWLILERIESVNGQLVTTELLMNDDGLDGDQRAALDRAIHTQVTPIEEDETILPDGRVLTRRKLKSAEYLSFKSQLGQNPTHGFRYAVLNSFLIDGKPLTLEDLENPHIVDFDLASLMVLRLASIFGLG